MKRRRTPTGFSPEVRAIILERSRGHCERCGVLTICGQAHHRRPRGAGGSRRPDTNLPSNALWLCSGIDGGLVCHEYIESHRTEALANGWLVLQSQSPADVPVVIRGSLSYLADDGSVLPAPPNHLGVAK